MKKNNLLIVLILSLFFIGCQAFEPELCHITIVENEHCTYFLENSSVPKNSFFKVTVVPSTGYYPIGFSSTWGVTYHKSTNEENTFFILAKEEYQTVRICLDLKPKYTISKAKNANNFKISSLEKAWEGTPVTFTIIPDDCFYFEPDTLEVRKINNNYFDYDYEKLSFTQSETNPNDFSFIMPDRNVEIFVETKFAIEVSPRKTNFKQGETIIFDINNHNPDDTFDIKIADGYSTTTRNDYKEIERGIKLSQIYELPYQFITDKYPETETGSYTLHIYPHNSDYYTKTESIADFVIALTDMPDGWTTIGLKNQQDTIYKTGNLVNFLLSNIDIPNHTNLKFNYLLENDNPSETIEGTGTTLFYNNTKSCYISPSYFDSSIDVKPFNKLVVWIEDDELKYQSRKISLIIK